MIEIATRQENLKDIINALRQEIKTEGSNVIINILSVESPKPKPITDPRRLLVEKRESIQELMARVSKDKWCGFKEVAQELGVSPQTIKKYCKFELIEGEWDSWNGWTIRQSELDRLKENKNWLKTFQQIAKNKPLPDRSEIFHKQRVKIMDEIEELHREHQPLNPQYAIKHYKGLYQRARRYFGSFQIAIRTCGIHISQAYIKWDSPNGMRGRPKMSEQKKLFNKEMLILKIRILVSEGKLTIKMKRKLDCLVRDYIGGWKKIKYLTDKKPNGEVEKC